MKIISMERGRGKTTELIRISCLTNTPIVCTTSENKRNIKQMAEKMKINIPEPICVWEFPLNGERIEKVLIDDVEYVLSKILNTNVDIVTTSCEIYDWK